MQGFQSRSAPEGSDVQKTVAETFGYVGVHVVSTAPTPYCLLAVVYAAPFVDNNMLIRMALLLTFICGLWFLRFA